MKVLITGGAGFVGRYFVEALNDEANTIDIIDIKGGYDCRRFFKEFPDIQYDLVIHLAAIVGGRESIEGRPMAVADNLSIDSEFFQWCLQSKPKKIVYFSSSAAYPTYLQTVEGPLSEEALNFQVKVIGSPDMTYGWSKMTGEFLAQFVDNVHIFRPFSGYGTDQDLNYPFPMYVQRAKDKADPFEVWGPGTQTRDFIHIKDIIEAVFAAIDNNVTGPINLGWGRSTSFIELAEMCMRTVGYKGEIVTRPEKPVGCMHRVADATKMLSFYQPKITLEEGISRAVAGVK